MKSLHKTKALAIAVMNPWSWKEVDYVYVVHKNFIDYLELLRYH